MLNKVLAFFSKIIHNAWQWSHMTLPPLASPPPLAFESSQCTVAQYKYTQPLHTHTDSYFRRGTACSRPRRGRHFKKK